MRLHTVLFTALVLTTTQSMGEPVEVLAGDVMVGDGAGGMDLDIDGDGVVDLNFAYFGISVNSIFAWDAIVRSGDGISDTRFAALPDANGSSAHPKLAFGDVINSSILNGSTFGEVGYENFFDGFSGGNWLSSGRGYVAFSFLSNLGSEAHFGWAEVSIDISGGTDDGFLIVHGVGYEDNINTPIEAGAGGGGCNEADLNGDGELDFLDISDFLAAFTALDLAADFNGDGELDFLDISLFLTAFTDGCP